MFFYLIVASEFVCVESLNLKEFINEQLVHYFRNFLIFPLGPLMLWPFLYLKEITLKIILFGKNILAPHVFWGKNDAKHKDILIYATLLYREFHVDM